MHIGKYVHISPNVTIGGGKNALLKIGNFCGIGAGSSVYTGSSNFVNVSLDFPTIPVEFRSGSIIEDIVFDNHVMVGAHAFIFPGVRLPEGFATAVGTVIRKCNDYQKWTLYGGNKCERLCRRLHKQYDEGIQRLLDADKKKLLLQENE
jgi:acetyltransferase-like isoleucine patch superfamily enzyme